MTGGGQFQPKPATLHRFFPTPDRDRSSKDKEEEDDEEDSKDPGPDR